MTDLTCIERKPGYFGWCDFAKIHSFCTIYQFKQQHKKNRAWFTIDKIGICSFDANQKPFFKQFVRLK